MDAGQVVGVMGVLAGFRVWVGGGWGVDALVGEVTREHQDLDLVVDAGELDAVLEVLRAAGFGVTTDWLPVRVEVTHPDGRAVDLHPVRFAADGSGVQAGFDGAAFEYAADGFGSGTIGGRAVPVLTAAQQLRFREGYDWRPVDHHDVRLLREVAEAERNRTSLTEILGHDGVEDRGGHQAPVRLRGRA